MSSRLQSSSPILDTHQHLIYCGQWPYSWTAGVPALAGRAFRYDDYLAAIAGAGITASIFMETTPDAPHWEHEAAFVNGLNIPAITGIIANCRPELPGFQTGLESMRTEKLVGFRRILHVEPDELSRSPLFAANLQLLGKLNLTFDLCVLTRQIPLAIDLIRQCPGIQFVLDHCGNPDIAAGEPAAKAWRRAIKDIAALPNVACKISGIVAHCKAGTVTTHLLRPYVEYCLENFGWDRVLWGSDWPVCLTRCTLTEWVSHTREIIAGQDQANQRKLLCDNGARIYPRLANA